MSERASQTAQRYVDAMNIASAKIEQLQAEVEALRAQVQRVRDVLSGAYINMTPPQITTNVYGDAGLVIAVTDVEYALEGDDA